MSPTFNPFRSLWPSALQSAVLSAEDWATNASELARERDAAGWEEVYGRLKELHLRECAEHERTGRWVGRLVRAVAVLTVLLAVSVLVVWRLLA